MTRRTVVVAIGLGVMGALLWLRDPVWLGDYTEGVTMVDEDGAGRQFRWTRGRASFYVDAAATAVELDLAGPEAFRVQTSVFVDGRLAGRVLLDRAWQRVSIATGAVPTTRRHRRIDLQVARTWGDQLGVRIGWPVRQVR